MATSGGINKKVVAAAHRLLDRQAWGHRRGRFSVQRTLEHLKNGKVVLGKNVKAVELNLPSTNMAHVNMAANLGARWEAMQCPDVVVADMDRSAFSAGNQTTGANVKPSCLPAPEGFASSLEWQEQQAADFADVRQGLVRHRLKMSRDINQKPSDLPKRSDEIGWCVFCLGTQMALQIQEKRALSRSKPDKHPSESLGITSEGSPPLLSIVALVSQTTIMKLLQYHISWLDDVGFSHGQGQWFYALLACLDKPLPPDTSALLRALARQCASFRASLGSPQSELLSPLNLIIALVSRYFGQSDLADYS